ncbi:MAG: type II toxin-antitoxin system VapC family toxin [Acidobacteriota bacterium]
MRVLLDTATFLWVAIDSPQLSPTASGVVTDANNEVFLSAVSAWEIAIKHSLEKLVLPARPEGLVPEIRNTYAIESLPLDEESTFQIGRLPRLHRDPFDRMLICQAIVHGLTILTPDELIRQYPVRTLW